MPQATLQKITKTDFNMADQINIGTLSLAESQHANGGMGGGRSTYIPPHMRGVPPAVDGPPPPMMNGNMGDGAWNGAGGARLAY